MRKHFSRYIILLIVILLPLLAAYLVGSYGYHSDKFGQGGWKTEFTNDYLKFADKGTTEEQIDEFLKFGINTQYFSFDATPIYTVQAQNNNGDALFKIKIFRSLYITTVSNEKVNRVQYLYFIYDIQYLQLREEFGGDSALQREIADADVPVLSVNVYEVNTDDTLGTKDAVAKVESKLIYDQGADVDYVNGENQDPNEDPITANLNYIYVGFDPAIDTDWSTKTKIEIVASVEGVTDNEGEDIKTTVFEEVLTNYECDPEAVDDSNFVASYQQKPENMGYASWMFWHYLWWIGLITFVAFGFITGSFYVVYLSEEQKWQQSKNSKKVKK
ncbi:MAG: hypothetical protein AB7T03_01015 [Bacilli bacterium]